MASEAVALGRLLKNERIAIGVILSTAKNLFFWTNYRSCTSIRMTKSLFSTACSAAKAADGARAASGTDEISMALHLIIDGYNLIRQSPELLAAESQDLRWGREALLEQLAAYRRLKKHPITVVFDGWEGGAALGDRDRFQGMLIVYSRRGEKADEVIKELAERERQRCLVISSDRDICRHAGQVGAAVMSAEEFSLRLQVACTGEVSEDLEEEEDHGRGTKKKGPAQRSSKKLRRWRQRLKKI